MKKIILLVVLFIPVISSKTDHEHLKPPFSEFNFALYGGINFNVLKGSGGSLALEVNSNLTDEFRLKLSLGYSRTYSLESYHVKTFSYDEFPGIPPFFQTEEYDVIKKGYDNISTSLGIQYIFNFKNIFPYIFCEGGYNIIGTKIYTSNIESRGYKSIEEVPEDFRKKHVEEIIGDSFRMGIGTGILYPITSLLRLDFRYSYHIDNRIINVHQFMVGILFLSK